MFSVERKRSFGTGLEVPRLSWPAPPNVFP